MNFGNFMKKAGERTAQQLAVRVLSKYEDRLDEAVENDYRLLERTNQYRPGLMEKAINISAKNRSFIADVEADDIMDLMEDKKPELYRKIHSDPERKKWAMRELKSILKYLKNEV